MTCTAEPNTPAAEFWARYHRYVAGEHGGPPDDPDNYWTYGALSCPLSGFDVPPEVMETWQATAAAYEAYVGLVAVFDELDVDHWRRWHALRRALPGVSQAARKALLATLSGIPTEDLVALCTAAQLSEVTA